MRSFQVCTCGQPLQMNTQPTPVPAGTEVLLKVLAAGVCHSDLHLSDGYFDLGGGKRLSVVERGMKLPVTLGHENVGEVVAAGPAAKGVKIGDRRLVDPWMGCGECGVCKRGDEQLCTKPRSIGVFSPGGYSDFVAYQTERPVLWGSHSGSLHRFELVSPVWRERVEVAARRHGVRYLVVERAYVDPRILALDKGCALVAEDGGFELFDLAAASPAR